MAKAHDLLDAIERIKLSDEDAATVMDELMMVALPMPLVKVLSDEAAKRNLTFGQLLANAISDYVQKTEPADPKNDPRLPMEG